MAILELLGASSISYIAGSAVVIFIFIEVAIAFRNRRADVGSYAERSLEREEGLGYIARALRYIKNSADTVGKHEELLERSERVEENKDENLKNKSAFEAVEAVQKGAEASEGEERAEAAAAAMEGRIVGIEASVKKIVKAIIEYTYKKKSNILSEEQESLVLDNILKSIRNTVKYNVIDRRINEYLKQFLGRLVSDIKQDVETEQQKNKLMENLAKELGKGVKVMKGSVRDARIELRKLRKSERKTRKSFQKEFSDLKASLKAKVKELSKLRKTKGADTKVIGSLETEISLYSQQFSDAKKIHNQLKAAYAFMKKEMKEMKNLLNYVVANEKEIKKYEKILEEREKQVNKRFKSLEEGSSSIENASSKFKTANPHEAALALSSSLKLYFQTYSKILEDDLGFDNAVKGIIIKNFVISQQIGAFQQLAAALTQSEEAVESGVEALTELIKGIADEASKTNISGIVQTLKNAAKILDYEKGIEAYMKNLAQTLENKSRQLSADIQKIIDEDKKLLAKIKAEEDGNASYLGSLMVASVKRKIEINRKYFTEARNFGQQLEQSNGKVANAYQQYLNVKSNVLAA